MSTQTRKTLKIVGIVVGSLLLVGGTVWFFVWRSRNKEEQGDENPYIEKKSTGNTSSSSTSSTSSTGSTNQSYTKEQIKKMQSWMLDKAIYHFHSPIIAAIQDTGGVDGIMGPGFNKALDEAIKIGWVWSLFDLYNKAHSKPLFQIN